MNVVLDILKKNSRLGDEEIAVRAGIEVEEVRAFIKEAEEAGIIAGYTTLINWDNAQEDAITALIQIKVQPQRGEGFDSVAKRIYQFDQVSACYLMSSGGFDLAVIVEGRSMKEVGSFVAEKLAIQEDVLGTATHFMLKKYKEHGAIYEEKHFDDRELIFL
ncbi:MAG: Lrp/AsnC family transcriptional regulator [Turicibacter sp.]|nr:Lrp/AsnC family transcriptional regulator [Turicibacter sp.]